MTSPFSYPAARPCRRGPRGYSDYASDRPWLRDEFSYRCAFCLLREQWGRVRGTFELDHFRPVSLLPQLGTVYENLLYACAGCNCLKSDQIVPDPTTGLTASTVKVTDEGKIHARTPEAQILIDGLGLDSEELRTFRMLWIGVIALASRYDPARYQRLTQYPDQLPDLSGLCPPDGNSRPEGITQSAFRPPAAGRTPTHLLTQGVWSAPEAATGVANP